MPTCVSLTKQQQKLSFWVLNYLRMENLTLNSNYCFWPCQVKSPKAKPPNCRQSIKSTFLLNYFCFIFYHLFYIIYVPTHPANKESLKCHTCVDKESYWTKSSMKMWSDLLLLLPLTCFLINFTNTGCINWPTVN